MWEVLSVPATRFVAHDMNPTNRPSLLTTGESAGPFACSPDELTLSRVVSPVLLSKTNTSRTPFVSPTTRLLDSDVYATKRPFALNEGVSLSPLDSSPFNPMVMRVNDSGGASIWVAAARPLCPSISSQQRSTAATATNTSRVIEFFADPGISWPQSMLSLS